MFLIEILCSSRNHESDSDENACIPISGEAEAEQIATWIKTAEQSMLKASLKNIETAQERQKKTYDLRHKPKHKSCI